MKLVTVLVCGSRNWEDQERVDRELALVYTGYEQINIVHGGARGADSMSGTWARKTVSPRVRSVAVFPADWTMYGKAAGPIRNKEMLDHLEYCKGQGDTLVLAFRSEGKSSGTDHMIDISRKAGFEVKVVHENEPVEEDQLKLNFQN